jgi:hypothetical protein
LLGNEEFPTWRTSVEYLSIVCAEAAPSLERGLVLVCAWDVSGFLPLVPRDRLYDEGFKG